LTTAKREDHNTLILTKKAQWANVNLMLLAHSFCNTGYIYQEKRANKRINPTRLAPL
jgi:hypothetical protein